MRRSDIFESFAKIAEEQGIISLDAPDKAKDKLENNPRADSLSIKDIESLYNVKPDIPKNMQYKRNIVENAHPTSIVIAPSHDKLHGLVENVNERQDILLNIVNKRNNGLATQHKYAEKELVLSLVRVANDLDNNGNDELRILADTCLAQINKKKSSNNQRYIKKGALPVVPILAGAAAVAALIGGVYLHQHLADKITGFRASNNNLLKELEQLRATGNPLVWGRAYTPFLINQVDITITKLKEVASLANYGVAELAKLGRIRTVSELVEEAKTADPNEVSSVQNKLQKAFDEIKPIIVSLQENFSNPLFRAEQTKDRGFLTNFFDKIRVTDQEGYGLIASDFQDVLNAIPSYLENIQSILDQLAQAKSVKDSVQAKLEAAKHVSEPKPAEAPAAAPVGTTTPVATAPGSAISNEAAIINQLSGA